MDSKTKETIERSKKWMEVLYPKKCKCGSHIREYQSECMKCTLTREFLPGEKIDFRKLLIKNIEPKEIKMEKSELKIGNKYKHKVNFEYIITILAIGEKSVFIKDISRKDEASYSINGFCDCFIPHIEDKFPHGEVVAHIHESGALEFCVRGSHSFTERETSPEWKMVQHSHDNYGQIQIIRG